MYLKTISPDVPPFYICMSMVYIWQRNGVNNQRLDVKRVKANIIKIIFCCYHVQISLTMSQQTQSDIFHTKMLQNALWCQITWSKCMLCNIEKCHSGSVVTLLG
jgi:hypothetical protein